jgi:hypothetical protein
MKRDTTMTKKLKIAAAAAAFAFTAPGAASAQYYGSPYAQAMQPAPLYPYVVQPQPGYAIAPQAYPQPHANERGLFRHKPRASRTDPALVEELRSNPRYKKHVINKTIIVREPPIVIEKKKYVDDPPRVIERRIVVDETEPSPAPKVRRKRAVASAAIEEPPAETHAERRTGKARVIRAEAEVTILGPDRMSIRLFRKGRGMDLNTSATAAD